MAAVTEKHEMQEYAGIHGMLPRAEGHSLRLIPRVLKTDSPNRSRFRVIKRFWTYSTR